jgi:hypothetical protein
VRSGVYPIPYVLILWFMRVPSAFHLKISKARRHFSMTFLSCFQDSSKTCYSHQSSLLRLPMDMLMIAFRTSLRERVHEILRTCGVAAYTEFPGAIGTGQSGSTEGISFYAGGNSVILVSLETVQREKVADAVKAWCAEAKRSGWVKPAVRVFCWPCTQLV